MEEQKEVFEEMKEKLMEILRNPIYPHLDVDPIEALADYLLDMGVTVQEWISVKDRLPERGQEVIVYSGGVLKSTVFAHQFWNKNYDSWARITHWMPLPQPPKGE